MLATSSYFNTMLSRCGCIDMLGWRQTGNGDVATCSWHRSWPCGQTLSTDNLSNNLFSAHTCWARSTGVQYVAVGDHPAGCRMDTGHCYCPTGTADWPPGWPGQSDRAWNRFIVQKTDFSRDRLCMSAASTPVTMQLSLYAL